MRTPRGPEKLIRDRIPAIAAADGRTLAVRTAGPDEMARLPGLKLVEESHEVLDALAAGRGDVGDTGGLRGLSDRLVLQQACPCAPTPACGRRRTAAR